MGREDPSSPPLCLPRLSTLAHSLTGQASTCLGLAWELSRRPPLPQPSLPGAHRGSRQLQAQKKLLWSHFCLDLPPSTLPSPSLCPDSRKPHPGPRVWTEGPASHPRISAFKSTAHLLQASAGDLEPSSPCTEPSSWATAGPLQGWEISSGGHQASCAVSPRPPLSSIPPGHRDKEYSSGQRRLGRKALWEQHTGLYCERL